MHQCFFYNVKLKMAWLYNHLGPYNPQEKSHVSTRIIINQTGFLNIVSGSNDAFQNNPKKENQPMWNSQIHHFYVQNKEAANGVSKAVKELLNNEVSDTLVDISIARDKTSSSATTNIDRYPSKVQLIKHFFFFERKDSLANTFYRPVCNRLSKLNVIQKVIQCIFCEVKLIYYYYLYNIFWILFMLIKKIIFKKIHKKVNIKLETAQKDISPIIIIYYVS